MNMVSGWTKTMAAAAVSALVVACGGGGGGAAVESEAVVTGVSTATVLEGSAASELLFTVTLDKPALKPIAIQYSTASTALAGGGSTGSATGGAACGAGVDYVGADNAVLNIAAGSSNGTIRVTLCGDTVFEPNETVRVAWSLSGNSGSVVATIVNDDAGGLNGTGVASSFGRDSQALTNAAGDGRLGFSFASRTDASATPTPVNCTVDNVTGLMWEGKGGAGGTLHDPAATFTFANLANHVAAVNAAQTCGFADWRLPTPEELASLVDSGKTPAPTIDAALPNTANAPFWTSTTYRDGTNLNAWFVDFDTGSVLSDAKTQAFRARLVRTNVANPVARAASCVDAGRFTIHADNTVTDNRTGLMWARCAEGQTGGACAGGAALALEWAAATARPAAVNAASSGHTDWRLPTRAELSSITEREQCDATPGTPSVIATVFPNTAFDYWTSTPDAFNGAQAWRVNFQDGEVSPAAKSGAPSSSKRVRLVRAGQ
jgi:hypothetical protein